MFILRIIICCTHTRGRIALASQLKIFCWWLSTVASYIVHLLDRGETVCAAFLDGSAQSLRFFRSSYRLLLQRLYDVNVSPAVLQWFKNYLNGRLHRVKRSGQYSDWQSMKGGIPQGSACPWAFVVLDLYE